MRRRHHDAADACRRLAKACTLPRAEAAFRAAAKRRMALARELRPHVDRAGDTGRSSAWAWVGMVPRRLAGVRLQRSLAITADQEVAAAEECERLLRQASSGAPAPLLARHAHRLRSSRGSLLASSPLI